jgi:hypothetical protein
MNDAVVSAPNGDPVAGSGTAVAPKRAIRAAWAGVFCVILGIALALVTLLLRLEILRTGWEHRSLTEVVLQQDRAYQARVAPAPTDVSSFRGVVLENGVPLQPGNATEDEVRSLGRGRFRFGTGHVLFSASDDSDPRVNGRTYVAYGPGRRAAAIRWLLLSVTLFTVLVGSAFIGLAIVIGWNPDSTRLTGPVLRPIVAVFGMFAALAIVGAVIVFLADPVFILRGVQVVALNSVGMALMFSAGVGASRLRRDPARSLATAIVLAAFGCVILGNPQSGNAEFSVPRLMFPVLLGVLSGIVVRGASNTRRVPPGGWLALTAACVLLAIPGTVVDVVQWWNISGFMDSQMYDLAAHQIALGEAVQGNGFVMPLYQYGMAAIYFVFGHFFFVQQVGNVALLLAVVVMMVAAGRRLFVDYRAALLLGILAALTIQFRQFVKLTQIENWYVPLVVLIVYAWAYYRAAPTWSRAIGLAAAIGLAFNCRSQGAFFFAWMCLSPLFQARLGFGRRLGHTAVIGGVVALMLVPWSYRNYLYEGRFSPSSDQATIGLLFNDHRVGFYGLRYDLYSWQRVLEEYEAKYPGKNERFAAIQRDYVANTFGDPAWWAKAFAWRTVSFYGLLPLGFFDPAGPRPPDWSVEWHPYLFNNITALALILASIIGAMMRPGRDALFLMGAIAANIAVMLVGSQIESRISFPVLPFHMLLAVAAVFPFCVAGSELEQRRTHPRIVTAPVVVLGIMTLAIGLLAAWVFVGRLNRVAPLLEKSVVVSASAVSDHRRQGFEYLDVDGSRLSADNIPQPGQRIRIRIRVWNYMLPPKSAGAVEYLPRFVSDPAREQYFFAMTPSGPNIGVTYFGAVADSEIREYDLVTVEGRVLEGEPVKVLGIPLWLHVEAIYK